MKDTAKHYKINKDIIWRKEKWTFMVLFPYSKRFLAFNKDFSNDVSDDWYIQGSNKNSKIIDNLIENKVIKSINSIPQDKQKEKQWNDIMAPLNVTFQITNRCNLNCLHCHRIKDNFHDLKLTEFEKIINQLREINVFNINISWWEPLLHPDIFEMISFAISKGLNVTISTNLLLRDNDITERMSKLWIKHIHISLDSYDANIHDQIRGIKGSYKHLLDNLVYLKKHNIEYTFVTTIIDQKPEDYEKTIDESFKLWAAAHKTNIFVHQWDWANYEREITDFTEYKTIRKKKKNEYIWKMKIIAESMFLIQLGQEYISPQGIPDILNCWCPAGILTCAINEKWDVLACPFFWDKPAGNVLKETFIDIRNKSELLNELRNRKNIDVCGNCKGVKVCWWCRARSYGLFKELNKKDPYCFLQN